MIARNETACGTVIAALLCNRLSMERHVRCHE